MQNRPALRTRILFLITALVLSLATGPQVMAQDSSTSGSDASQSSDDGQGFLARTLQNALSGAGRTVKISGFTGALSSKAKLGKMTIADDKGVWLELDNAELDWSRSALLTGKVQINKLSAESLTIYRKPEAEQTTSAPSVEAPGFSIPKLPVSINIGELAIDKVDLKEPVIGEAAVLSVTGKANLAGGALDSALQVQRQDQPGQIDLAASYDPDKQNLGVDIKVNEPAGGLVAKLMNLPGEPSVNLTVAGTGPLDNYSADMKLMTDGKPRLSGNVTLRGRDDGGREFTVQAGGDLTALAAPQYRDFLGTDIGVDATGLMAADGALNLQMLRVKSAAVNLQGKLALDKDHNPQSFDLKGRMAAPDGSDRLDLPFADGVSLASADVDMSFDAAKSPDVSGQILATSPAAQGFSADKVALDISGPLNPGGTSDLTLKFDAAGLNATDPGIAQAIGNQITGSADVHMGNGPLKIDNLKIDGPALALTGNASMETKDAQAQINVNADADVSDLSNFSKLSGLDLKGAAKVGLQLTTTQPDGTIHLVVNGEGQNLATGISQVDALLNSPAKVALDVTRGADGITLKTLDVGTDAIQLTGGGQIGSKDGKITYDLKLADAGLMTGTHSGPAELSGELSQQADGLHVTATGGGTDLAVGIPQVDGLLKGKLGIDIALISPKDGAPILQTGEIHSDALNISASGNLDPKAMKVDLKAMLANSAVFTGGQAGPFSLTGTVRTSDDGTIHALLKGGGDQIGTGIEQVDRLLNGPTDITADVTSKGGLITLNDVHVDAGGFNLRASGDVQDGAPDINLTARLPNSGAALGAQTGPLELDAHVGAGTDGGYVVTANGTGKSIGIGNPQIDALFAGNSTLAAKVSTSSDGTIRIEDASVKTTALSANASGTVGGNGPDITFNARLDNLARLVDGLNGPLTVDGRAQQEQGGIHVSVKADGPSGSDAVIEGLVAKADGSVDLTVKGSAPLALANPFIAPQSLTGKASFDLAMNGQPGLPALSGTARLSGGRLVTPEYDQNLKNIAGTVSLSGGRAQLNLTAAPEAGGQIAITGPITLSAPYDAGLRIALKKAKVQQGDFATTTLNGTIALDGGLTGGGTISGRIGLSDSEIRLSSVGFGGQEAIPDMTQVGESAASRATRSRAGLIKKDSGSGGSSGGNSDLKLNLTIATDSSVFIRGRGLDAELRGSLALRGTTSNPEPVGEFDLVRGRLDILTKRLDLSQGSVQLAGGFEPLLNFVATSQSGSYAVTITIDGTASDPEVTFASTPDLPQDEILSQLFFNSSISSLSPLQAAQLASAVATLTGQGNGGIFGKLRDKTGLDDLDVSTSADGETTLTAGKYISDKLYTETEVTGQGTTSLSINLDLTNSVKAKGSVSSDGNTGLGLFFEKDY